MPPSDQQTIAKGAGLTLPGTLLGNGILLAFDFYLNQHLTTSDYGVYGSVRRLLTLLGLAGQLGMENAVLRRIASGGEAASTLRGAIRGTMLFSGLLGLGLILGAASLGTWFGGEGTATVLMLGGLSLPLAALRLAGVTASQAWKAVGDRVLVMLLLWPVVQFTWFFLLKGEGMIGASVAYLGSMAVGALTAVAMMGRRRPGILGEILRSPGVPVRELLAFSWPLWLQAMLAGAYGYLDQILLAGLRSAEDAGYYGPVATLAPLFGLGLGSLNSIFAPIIAERHAAGDREGLAGLYRTVSRWALVLSLPPLVLSEVMPEAVLGLWPHGSPIAAPALRVIAGCSLGATAVGSVNYLLIMSGHSRSTLLNSLPATILNLVSSLLLAPSFGVTGAAVANGTALLAANFIGLAQVWKILKIHPFHWGMLRSLAAALPSALTMWMIRGQGWGPWPTVTVGGILGGIVFLVTLGLLGFDNEDRELIAKITNRLGRRR